VLSLQRQCVQQIADSWIYSPSEELLAAPKDLLAACVTTVLTELEDEFSIRVGVSNTFAEAFVQRILMAKGNL